MGVEFDLVTLDTEHPSRQQSFWCALLDLVEAEREDGDRWIVLSGRDGRRRIGLQRGAPRPGSVHLDLACRVDEFESELDRMIGLGAVVLRGPRAEPYGSIANLEDPDGNLFDLCAYATGADSMESAPIHTV